MRSNLLLPGYLISLTRYKRILYYTCSGHGGLKKFTFLRFMNVLFLYFDAGFNQSL
jgi:hypothetical protein